MTTASSSSLIGFSAFSGIGGFEHGFRMAGVPIDWAGHSEIDPYPESIHRYHFTHPNYGDLTTLTAQDLPDFDLLVAGFPCQAFSVAGRRKGFQDRRGSLFFELARLLRDKTPRYFLLENVKGLLSHDKGRTFSAIVRTLVELGYCVEWCVCNSTNFAVPQHRERVFLIGYLGAVPARKVFPLTGKGATDPSEQVPATTATTSRRGVRYAHHRGQPEVRNRFVSPVYAPDQQHIRQSQRFKSSGAPAYTLVSSKLHGIYDGKHIRKLTPREWERLQGFPDDWTRLGRKADGSIVDMSDTRRYHVLGNAVTTTVVAAIARKLFPHLSESP